MEKCLQYMLRPDMVMLLDMSQKMALILIGQDSKSPISKNWICQGLGWLKNNSNTDWSRFRMVQVLMVQAQNGQGPKWSTVCSK
jgi:hypothetical protein